jgi:dTDP-4-dehydrorhamnose reductase
MNTVVVLGSTGMIGSAVTKYLSEKGVQLTEVNRAGRATNPSNKVIKFDALTDDTEELINRFSKGTIFINLIGTIRHKIETSRSESVIAAKIVNSVFPRELSGICNMYEMRVIQIATDCIFSGKEGNYSELSAAEPIDIYGESKLNGELQLSNLLTLRVSVVGHEIQNHVELMDWVLGQPRNAVIKGYTNHVWNGVTSLHFGKIVNGILEANDFNFGTFHVVPNAPISKSKLISLIATYAQRPDLKIEEFAAEIPIDRTLTTEFTENNSMIWKRAGYESPPTINFMLKEYFEWISRT